MLYAVHLRKEAIVGFRSPPLKQEPGEGENIVRSGEVRAASHLIAVMGMPSPMQCTWANKDSACHIAVLIKGRVITITGSEESVQKVSGKSKILKTPKRSKASKKKGSKENVIMSKKKKSALKKKPSKGDSRECGVCHKLGHNARSHALGGRLA